jgi:histidinol phosphatase-like PHP family hydrolase
VAPTNAQLGERLLEAARGEERGSHRERAMTRAARAAYFDWPEEAADIAASGRGLTELRAVGPWLALRIEDWLSNPPGGESLPLSPLRANFMTRSKARQAIAGAPGWAAGLQGDLQMHTTYSDGKATLRTMVEEAARLGYRHVNITDHSRGLPIAHGMDETRLGEQAEEIRQLNDELSADHQDIRVLHGIEMNLSPDGEGDMDGGVLRTLDLVLGAFHSALRRTDDQTDRYLKALATPTIHVLAHPRGRRFGARLGLQADWATVIKAAAANHKALEIDAHPERQDLDVETLRLVRDVGGWVSIGTDAHRPDELRFMEFGLAAAISAGIPQSRILNFLTSEELLEWAETAGSTRRARPVSRVRGLRGD